MTKTPASLRSDPLAALLHNGGRFASESLAVFSGIRSQVAYLRHGYNLLYKAGRISITLPATLLEGENIREGFINRPEFDALTAEIKDQDTRDIIRFDYLCGWRSGEAKKLPWDKFNPYDWVFLLPRKNSKNKRPRTLTLVGELREIVERRLEKRLPHCPYVFHRNGKPIKSFRKAFEAAAIKVGLGQMVEDETGPKHYEGIVPHDMRRSAVRNFHKAGISQAEGMSITGHETDSVYKRYAIIDEEMQREALERVMAHQAKEIEKRKVFPIKKKQVS
jgi:integrase